MDNVTDQQRVGMAAAAIELAGSFNRMAAAAPSNGESLGLYTAAEVAAKYGEEQLRIATDAAFGQFPAGGAA